MRDVAKQNKIHRVPMIYQFSKIKKKSLLIFGEMALVSIHRQRVEGLCIIKLKLKIKKKIKRKKRQSRSRRGKFSYWLRYHPSTFFTKKSKNARMGSGKGKYVRRASTVLPNQSFVEFKYIKRFWVFNFKKYLLNKFGLSLQWRYRKSNLALSLVHTYTNVEKAL